MVPRRKTQLSCKYRVYIQQHHINGINCSSIVEAHLSDNIYAWLVKSYVLSSHRCSLGLRRRLNTYSKTMRRQSIVCLKRCDTMEHGQHVRYLALASLAATSARIVLCSTHFRYLMACSTCRACRLQSQPCRINHIKGNHTKPDASPIV